MKPGSWTFADPIDPEWVHETFYTKEQAIQAARKFYSDFCLIGQVKLKNGSYIVTNVEKITFNEEGLAKMKMKFTVLKNEDIERYVPKFMANTLEDICKHIEDGRKKDGKKPKNTYIVINMDEPYATEVIEILKRHGHWG
jgi:hypothetical protein